MLQAIRNWRRGGGIWEIKRGGKMMDDLSKYKKERERERGVGVGGDILAIKMLKRGRKGSR